MSLNDWQKKFIHIMNIHQITFSPTGGTRRVSELLCKGFGAENSCKRIRDASIYTSKKYRSSFYS